VVVVVEMMAQIVQIILEDLVVRVVVHPIKIHQVLPVRVSLVKEMLVALLVDLPIPMSAEEVVVPAVLDLPVHLVLLEE
jgi:hypothetical protein